MYRPGVLTCYIGLLAGAATGNFSAAVITRSANTNPHYDIMDTGSALIQAATTAIDAEDVTAACLPTMNMLRVLNLRDQALKALEPETGGASVEEGEGEEDQEELTKSNTAADIAKLLAGTAAETCEKGATADAKTHTGLVISFEFSATFDCGSLIQGHFSTGLSHIQESNFDPATGTYDTGKAPFDNLSASNVANIMWSKSTKASCAVTKNCKAGHNVLYCRFVEPITSKDKPFTLPTFVLTKEPDRYARTECRKAQRLDMKFRDLQWPMMHAADCRTELYEALLQRQAGSSSIALPSIAITFFCAALLLLS